LNATVLEDDEDDINSFDLNLPLDEFGAVDFDFVENNTGKLNCTTLLFLERWLASLLRSSSQNSAC
jgi:hypothetical protein